MLLQKLFCVVCLLIAILCIVNVSLPLWQSPHPTPFVGDVKSNPNISPMVRDVNSEQSNPPMVSDIHLTPMVSNMNGKQSNPHLTPMVSDVKGEQSNPPMVRSMNVGQENHSVESQCLIPPDGFKSWNQKQLTLVYPTVKRDCSKLIAGGKKERIKVRDATKGWKSSVSYGSLMEVTSNCSLLRDMFKNTLYISKLELSFPIAFIFVVYESPEQFLRLLKVLYRPHNAYCIHPDIKSKYYQFFTNIAKCFPNIVISKHQYNVMRVGNTVVKAQRSCYTDLIHYRQQQKEEEKWRYVINLCGKELPLTSGREMVKKLISMNGTSCIKVLRPVSDKQLNGKRLPYNLKYYKSLTYTALSEPFIHFMLHNRKAIALYDLMLETIIPEEHFYATLFMAPGTPGGYNPHIPMVKYIEMDHCFWRITKKDRKRRCFGKTVHNICVVNFGDLPRIMKETENGRTALFHNKYFMELDHVVMDCMEERIVHMNKREYEMECTKH